MSSNVLTNNKDDIYKSMKNYTFQAQARFYSKKYISSEYPVEKIIWSALQKYLFKVMHNLFDRKPCHAMWFHIIPLLILWYKKINKRAIILFSSQYWSLYTYSSTISSILKHTFEIQINKHCFYWIIKEVKYEKRRLWPWPILIPKCNVMLKNTHDIKMLFSDKIFWNVWRELDIKKDVICTLICLSYL